MIKDLEIEHFRSHVHSRFDFVKGINCIIGLPDSGKTNVIRAINWALTNRPLNRRMISDFSDDAAIVKIGFDEGNVISLTKDKKTAMYILNKTELKAIGSDVPDDVTKVANISELNLQGQLDKPFLICSSSGEVAKIFNRVTKLEKPDEAVTSLTTAINSQNKLYKQYKIDEVKLKEEIEALGNVEELQNDFRAIESAQMALQKITTKNNELAAVLKELEEAEKVKDKYKTVIVEMEADLKDLQKLVVKYEEADDSYEELSDCVNELLNTKESMKEEKENLTEKAKEYRKFLNTIKVCPFCDKCKTPISAHNLDDAIKGII
jgi:DNA repair exonuclease SbcCD ATPase subunit